MEVHSSSSNSSSTSSVPCAFHFHAKDDSIFRSSSPFFSSLLPISPPVSSIFLAFTAPLGESSPSSPCLPLTVFSLSPFEEQPPLLPRLLLLLLALLLSCCLRISLAATTVAVAPAEAASLSLSLVSASKSRPRVSKSKHFLLINAILLVRGRVSSGDRRESDVLPLFPHSSPKMILRG